MFIIAVIITALRLKDNSHNGGTTNLKVQGVNALEDVKLEGV